MPYIPIIVAFLLAILNWIAADRQIKALEYVTKPATMLALLWWIGSSVGFGGSMVWFSLGVVFCLAGDVFLMVPRDMFIFGLVAFLLGHICYSVGLNNQGAFHKYVGSSFYNYFGCLYRVALSKTSKRADCAREKRIENPGTGLFIGDKLDGLLSMDDLDPFWLAGFSWVICQHRCSVVFHF